MTEIVLKGKKGAFKDLMKFIVETDLIDTIGFDLTVVKPNFEQILVIKPKESEEISKEDFQKISNIIFKN